MVFRRAAPDTGDKLRISKYSMAIAKADRVCGEDRKGGGENKVGAGCNFGTPYSDSRYRRTLRMQNYDEGGWWG